MRSGEKRSTRPRSVRISFSVAEVCSGVGSQAMTAVGLAARRLRTTSVRAGDRAVADVEAARREIVLPASPRSAPRAVEVVDIGAKDLHAPLIRLEELPGPGGRMAGANAAGRVRSIPSASSCRGALGEIVADRGEIAEAIRPDAHPDQGVRGRTAERVEVGAAIGQHDVVDDQAGVGDVVGRVGVGSRSRESKVSAKCSVAC